MDANLRAVLLWHNHQATSPHIPFAGSGSATVLAAVRAAVPAKEEPPPAEPEPVPAEEEKKPNG